MSTRLNDESDLGDLSDLGGICIETKSKQNMRTVARFTTGMENQNG